MIYDLLLSVKLILELGFLILSLLQGYYFSDYILAWTTNVEGAFTVVHRIVDSPQPFWFLREEKFMKKTDPFQRAFHPYTHAIRSWGYEQVYTSIPFLILVKNSTSLPLSKFSSNSGQSDFDSVLQCFFGIKFMHVSC